MLSFGCFDSFGDGVFRHCLQAVKKQALLPSFGWGEVVRHGLCGARRRDVLFTVSEMHSTCQKPSVMLTGALGEITTLGLSGRLCLAGVVGVAELAPLLGLVPLIAGG